MKKNIIRWIVVPLAALMAFAVLCFALAQVNLGGSGKDGMRKATRASMQAIRTAMDMYEVDCGKLPPTEGWFHALTNADGVPGWRGPYLRGGGGEPTDAWGIRFQYTVEKKNPCFRSAGRDMKFGTADDITNK
jgi:general secretion pathway protein G